MASFLEGVQKLSLECGVSTTLPTGVENQAGTLLRLVTWYRDAWKDIQNRHGNWRWMRRKFTFNTVASDGSYAFGDATDVDAAAAISRFKNWWVNDAYRPIKCYLQSGGVAGQYRMLYMPLAQFEWMYRFGTQTNGRPLHVTVDDQDNLLLGPTPDAVYVIQGDFQRGVQVLEDDDDEADLPLDYHDLIVYWAMQKYGANSVAAEVFQRAVMEGSRLMRSLEGKQLPQLELADPMA